MIYFTERKNMLRKPPTLNDKKYNGLRQIIREAQNKTKLWEEGTYDKSTNRCALWQWEQLEKIFQELGHYPAETMEQLPEPSFEVPIQKGDQVLCTNALQGGSCMRHTHAPLFPLVAHEWQLCFDHVNIIVQCTHELTEEKQKVINDFVETNAMLLNTLSVGDLLPKDMK